MQKVQKQKRWCCFPAAQVTVNVSSLFFCSRKNLKKYSCPRPAGCVSVPPVRWTKDGSLPGLCACVCGIVFIARREFTPLRLQPLIQGTVPVATSTSGGECVSANIDLPISMVKRERF